MRKSINENKKRISIILLMIGLAWPYLVDGDLVQCIWGLFCSGLLAYIIITILTGFGKGIGRIQSVDKKLLFLAFIWGVNQILLNYMKYHQIFIFVNGIAVFSLICFIIDYWQHKNKKKSQPSERYEGEVNLFMFGWIWIIGIVLIVVANSIK